MKTALLILSLAIGGCAMTGKDWGSVLEASEAPGLETVVLTGPTDGVKNLYL